MFIGQRLNNKGEENRGYKCNLIWTDENFSVSIIIGFSFKKIYGGSFATYETIY